MLHIFVVDCRDAQPGRCNGWDAMFDSLVGNRETVLQLGLVTDDDLANLDRVVIFAHRRFWNPVEFDAFIGQKRNDGLHIEGWVYAADGINAFCPNPLHVRRIAILNQNPLFGPGGINASDGLRNRLNALIDGSLSINQVHEIWDSLFTGDL